MLAQNLTVINSAPGLWKIQITYHAGKRLVLNTEFRQLSTVQGAAKRVAAAYGGCPVLWAAPQQVIDTAGLPAEWAAVAGEVNGKLVEMEIA